MRFFDPLQEFNVLRREIDRAFDSVRSINTPRNAFLPGRSPRAFPYVNLREDAEAIHVEALAPGIDPEKLQISVLRNQLTISGEKPAAAENVAAENYHRNEREAGRFVRTLTLPTEVDNDRVTAEYKAGILKVNLPKAEAAKPRKIAVSVG